MDPVFQTQITIVGVVDYLSNLPENSSPQDTRNSLLIAIRVSYTNKILEDKEISVFFKDAFQKLPQDATMEATIEAVAKAAEGKIITNSPLMYLKESAKEVLVKFATEIGKPNIINQINSLLG